MIKIKAWFGEWKTVDFEGAKRFFERYRIGVPENVVKAHWHKHFQGVDYEEFRG